MNNLSDSDDESRSDESTGDAQPAKRKRADTYGASSTTSHGSVAQESDDEAESNSNYAVGTKRPSNALRYTKQSSENGFRLSRSSVSEAGSSLHDHYDEYRPANESVDSDNGEYSSRPGFQHSSETEELKQSRNKKMRFKKQSPENNLRLSRSSLSESCSSPNDQYDDIRPTFDSVDSDNGENSESITSNYPDTNETFYSKNSNKSYEKSVSGSYSENVKRMMSNMGFKPGKGLGKYEHGRVDPVEASVQKGRRGLGLKPSIVGEVPQDFKWSPDEDKPEAKEVVSWMPAAPNDTLVSDLLRSWIQTGSKKLTIDDETDFVVPQILKGVLESKTIFDNLDDADLRQARFRSNPYETIGSSIFLNRAAVKMANIDAIFDFMFTRYKQSAGVSRDKELLYFADVCAGPGGFSEYVLYRCGWEAKGFGFTLKGPNDFKLSDFYAGTPETFNTFYGVNEDGNIFNPANLTSLKDQVLAHTENKGVHFLMADGGFSVEGQENIQEILSKQLYLCQCLAALMLVRTGGHFVVKLFDIFTRFSVGLIYIMYRCFDHVCIHKPVTCRPANSERYLVCKLKKQGTEAAEQHLFSVNSMLWNNHNRDQDVTELVPMTVIQEDQEFFEYIYKSNCVLGEKQIKSLLKIAEFSKDKNLSEDNQAQMRVQCLELWQLPDKMRTKPERLPPDDTLFNILSIMKKRPPESHNLSSFKSSVLNRPPDYLDKPTALETFKSVYDWHVIFLSSSKNSPDLKFFIGCGGKQVYQLDGSKWKSVVDLQLTLPAKTLIYGEIVKEYKGQGNNQMYTKALHVIDALMLGGIDISHMTLTDRLKQCDLFCTALYKPFDQNALPIRSKRLFNMEWLPSDINRLEFRAMKRVKKAVTLDIHDKINGAEVFHTVGSVLFIKELKEPWVAQISKSSGYKYYFRIGPDKKPQSEYHIPQEARLDMISAYSSRVMWPWEPEANAIFEGVAHGGVTRAQIENYILKNTKR